MANARGERPVVRRPSVVFVEIPPSPFHTARKAAKHPHMSSTSTGCKENALSRLQSSQIISSTASTIANSHKRKLDAEGNQSSTKKPKAQTRPVDDLEDIGDEYPNGFVYCHQCDMKRDVAVSVQCTILDKNGRRCRAKYCDSCLKKRYGLILEDILANITAAPRTHSAHVREGYFFACPLCDGICSCIACRHSRGLQPTGLTNVTPQSSLGRAAEVTRQDSKTAGSTTDRSVSQKVINKGKAQMQASSTGHGTAVKSAPPLQQPIRSKVGGIAKQSISSSSKHPNAGRVKEAPKTVPKIKRIPPPTWTDLDISLSLAEAEQRIHIREFTLRFASVIEISRAHLDELEEMKPYRSGEESELVPWVSEGCVKSLTVGLLNLLDVEGEDKKRLNSVIKSIKESGSNLNKIWCALNTLRGPSTSPRVPSGLVSFPDPLPAPTSISMVRTRSGTNQAHTGDINVIRTAQLIPIISALVDKAIQSKVVKQEIDSCINEVKERTKEARETYRMENERFELSKEKDQKGDKSKSEQHKQIMADIGDALKVVLKGYVTRISPLGRDMDGRTYWALTPGIKETEAALSCLTSFSRESKAASSKVKRLRFVPSEEDRRTMKKWSWFLAVWGPAPPASERTRLEDSEDEDSKDDAEERWWGFWDPKEITKLANWIRSKSCLGDVEPIISSAFGDMQMDDLWEVATQDSDNSIPTRNEVESLVKELDQYATLLKYRTRRDETVATSRK